jgi:hypothetical protein
MEGAYDVAPVGDRRRLHTLRMVGRVALQVLTILAILLVTFGRPSNLGTFLDLAGAGLTVALKDFVVGFFGWFGLLGPDGIRPGDLVEINGVTGEVIEVGIFQTVLLETGDWGGSSHLTGRRVTFNNSFAIEGHYFNFSTSGQWLWDELQIVVPGGARSVSDQRISPPRGRGSDDGERAADRGRVEGGAPHAAVLDADGSTDGEPQADSRRRGDRGPLRDARERASGASNAVVSCGDGPVGVECARQRGIDERPTALGDARELLRL